MRKAESHRCYKCVHLAVCGDTTLCNYFENTGKLRTFPMGPNGPHEAGSDTAPCPHYRRNNRRSAVKTVPPFRTEKRIEEPKADGRRKIRVTWDVEKAKALYLQGESYRSIAEKTGGTESAIRSAVTRYGWKDEKTTKKDGRKNNGTYRRKRNHPETAE